MKIRFGTIATFVFLVPLLASAGGPTYSRFGIGDLLFFGSGRSYGMGGASLALMGDEFINRINPAGLAKIARTRFSGAFEYVRSSSEDPTGKAFFGHGTFQNLAFAIPLSVDAGSVLFGGAAPYSIVKYNIERRESQAPIASRQTYFGDGGLSSLALGTSYSVLTDFTVGLKFNYVYGTIRQIAKVDFDDNTFTDNETHTSFFHSGSNFTFGATYEGIGTLLGTPSLKPLTIGMILTTPSRLSVKKERLLTTTGIADTTLVERNTTDLPFTFGAGVSYTFEQRYVVAADFSLQRWEESNFFGTKPAEIRNSTRMGIGFEALPARDPKSYLERVAYRGGFSYNASYLQLNGQPINEWFVSGGLGLPLGLQSRIDIGLQYGVRGTLSNSLQKDTFLRLSVSLSASEAWFLTIEED